MATTNWDEPFKIRPTYSEILRVAAEVLRVRGKCEGQYSNERGNVCMGGAIGVIEGIEVPTKPFMRLPLSTYTNNLCYLITGILIAQLGDIAGIGKFSDDNDINTVITKMYEIADMLEGFQL